MGAAGDALSDLTASAMKTSVMSAILDQARVLIAEIWTESASAEVAVSAVVCCVAAYVSALLAAGWIRGSGAVAARTSRGWGAVRVAALSVVFVVLAVQVHLSGWLTGADVGVLDWFAAHRSPAVTSAARMISVATGPVGVVVLAAGAVALVAWLRRSWRPGALVFVLGPGLRACARAVLAAVVTAAVGVVAATGLYLGVHWLTDVLGGVILGAAIVTTGSLVAAGLADHRTEGDGDALTVAGHTVHLPRIVGPGQHLLSRR